MFHALVCPVIHFHALSSQRIPNCMWVVVACTKLYEIACRNFKSTLFRFLTPYWRIEIYRRFFQKPAAFLYADGSSMCPYNAGKYVSTRLHDITWQKVELLVFTDVREGYVTRLLVWMLLIKAACQKGAPS